MAEVIDKVVLVLEPEYGEKLAQLATDSEVWVVDTPTNRAAASEYWKQNSTHLARLGITTFKFSPDASRLETFLAILETVDLHHAGYSSNPAYSELGIIGLPLTRPAIQALRELGFAKFESSAEGFRAKRI